jgi:hypothetical protein
MTTTAWKMAQAAVQCWTAGSKPASQPAVAPEAVLPAAAPAA